jgi:transposase-like protein
MRYTDEFRAQAIVMLEAAGWPQQKGALTRTAKTIGVSYQLLAHWARHQQTASQKLLREKTFDLIQALRDEVQAIIHEMPNARPDADFKELGTVLGIIVDKLQLLEGKATERVEVMSDDERANRIATILDTARKRRDRPADTGGLIQ